MIRKTLLLVTLFLSVSTVYAQGEEEEGGLDEFLDDSIENDLEREEDGEDDIEIAEKRVREAEKRLIDFIPVEDNDKPRFNYKEALADTNSETGIAVSSCIGLIVWFWFMFFYAQTTYTDNIMSHTVPLAWWWNGLGHATLSWTAASYLFYFLVYGAVSVPEFVGFLMLASGGDPLFLAMWAQAVGLWVGLALKFIPWLLALLQIYQPTQMSTTSDGFVNAVVMTAVGFVAWMVEFILHAIFAQRYALHAKALVMSECLCQPFIPVKDAPEKIQALWMSKLASECSVKLHKPKCQKRLAMAVGQNCTLEKIEDETDEEYQTKCMAAVLCPVTRTAEDSDLDYLIKCKSEEFVRKNTFNAEATAEVEEEDEEEIQADEEVDAEVGQGW